MLATEAAEDAAVPVKVADGVAGTLPLEEAACDGAASLMLCSVPDQPAALAELSRVIRPVGSFYEHVGDGSPGFARFQRVIYVCWPVFWRVAAQAATR